VGETHLVPLDLNIRIFGAHLAAIDMTLISVMTGDANDVEFQLSDRGQAIQSMEARPRTVRCAQPTGSLCSANPRALPRCGASPSNQIPTITSNRVLCMAAGDV
jgi:hypothetical protein